jgi:hypothetical protein
VFHVYFQNIIKIVGFLLAEAPLKNVIFSSVFNFMSIIYWRRISKQRCVKLGVATKMFLDGIGVI